jgi:hypothetical protein
MIALESLVFGILVVSFFIGLIKLYHFLRLRWHSKHDKGYQRLWLWFGFTRASWLTIPRSLMHKMPDKWQYKMAKLLEEYDETWDFSSLDYETSVSVKKDNKFFSIPNELINYRHLNSDYLNSLKKTK